MTEQPPSSEALRLVNCWVQPYLPTKMSDANAYSCARAIDALIAQRVSAESERIAAAFKIPVLALTARPGEITEADKAWADGVIDALCAETERWQNRDRQRLEQIARLQETVQSLQIARHERPAPKGPRRLMEGMRREGLPDDHPLQTGPEQPAIRPTDPDVLRASLNSLGPSHDGAVERDLIASTGEQPAPPAAVVDCTKRAREIVTGWYDDGPYVEDLTKDVATALSAVASERDDAALLAFGKRVYTEEVAYQAGVRDTLARLREPDVREAVADVIRNKSTWNTQATDLADAAIAKIVEMLK